MFNRLIPYLTDVDSSLHVITKSNHDMEYPFMLLTCLVPGTLWNYHIMYLVPGSNHVNLEM